MKRLDAHEVPLFKVFSSDYEFAIPSYQRPYTWDAEDAGQLLDDLNQLAAKYLARREEELGTRIPAEDYQAGCRR